MHYIIGEAPQTGYPTMEKAVAVAEARLRAKSNYGDGYNIYELIRVVKARALEIDVLEVP